MEKIDENGNIIIYTDEKQLENCTITFNSKNSICYIKDAVLKNARISFAGNEATFFVGKTRLENISIGLHTRSSIYIGDNTYINPGGSKSIGTSERNNIFIGDKCAISFNFWIRIADPHLIYDIKSKKRINPSKSVFIGDHVWIGQDVGVTKGAMISSGSIVGAKSLVSSSPCSPNTIIAGVPAKIIKSKIFWSAECVHNWEIETSAKYEIKDDVDDFVFNKLNYVGRSLSLEVDLALKKAKSAQERLKILQEFHANKSKSRFVFSKNDKIFSSAIEVVNEHLSYKLGRAMIENSKNTAGYIKMPFVLLKIFKNHKGKSLPNLKALMDYEAALEAKNSISYRLGAELIKAWKTWYKGGLIKLFFEINKIKKEHKK